MIEVSTSYTHKLITHFSLTLGSVCMSVSVGVRICAHVRVWACTLTCACARAHENKPKTKLFIYTSNRVIIKSSKDSHRSFHDKYSLP